MNGLNLVGSIMMTSMRMIMIMMIMIMTMMMMIIIIMIGMVMMIGTAGRDLVRFSDPLPIHKKSGGEPV